MLSRKGIQTEGQQAVLGSGYMCVWKDVHLNKDVLCRNTVWNIYHLTLPSDPRHLCSGVRIYVDLPVTPEVGTEAQGKALSLAFSCTLMWQPPYCTSANSDPPGDVLPARQEWQGLYKWPILNVQNKCHLKVSACSSTWQHVLIEWLWNMSQSASVSRMCGIHITAFWLRNIAQWELIYK